MNLLSGTVMGAAALVTSPALYHGFVTGAVPMDTAIMKWLVALAISWVAISIVAALVGDPVVAPAASPTAAPPEPAEPPPAPAV